MPVGSCNDASGSISPHNDAVEEVGLQLENFVNCNWYWYIQNKISYLLNIQIEFRPKMLNIY